MEKVEGWSADVTRLAKIAQSQPHAAYSAFTKGLSSRWIYVLHTIPDIAKLLQPLEDVCHSSGSYTCLDWAGPPQ